MKSNKKLVLIFLVLMSLFLAACGDKEAAINQQDTEAATKVIQDLYGDIEIPTKPERIVTTYDDDADHLLALGIVPVGVPTFNRRDNVNGYIPYLADRLEGVAQIGNEAWENANFEAIVVLEPDLILAGEWADKAIEGLKKIAPTAVYKWEADWRDRHLEFGRLLNREEEAQKNVAAYNKKLAEKRKLLEEKGLTDLSVAFIRIVNDKRIIVYTEQPSDIGSLLYDGLGFKLPVGLPADEYQVDMILEGLTTIEADVFYLLVNGTDEARAAHTDIVQTEVWKQLPAVANSMVFYVDNETPWARGAGPIGFMDGIDQLVDAIINVK